MKEIGNLKFHRAIIHADAVNLNIHMIDTADASNQIACAAIYVRFFRRNGSYSCQLIFSRSKIIPDGLLQPIAEFFAATMNAHTGEIVRRSLHSNYKGKPKLTDSHVVLHWISNNQKPVKQLVQNKLVEILRFTESSEWMFVCSEDMIADLGTGRVNDLNLVNKDSTWINGYDLIKKDQKVFPAKSIQIRLENEDLSLQRKIFCSTIIKTVILKHTWGR